MTKINIAHLGNEHTSWTRSLNFYKTEILILKLILTELAGKNSGKDVMKEVEHYENVFRIHINNIDTISHEIQVNASAIGRQAQAANAGYIDGELAATQTALGAKVESEEDALRSIIREFRKFAAQWM